MLFKKKFNKLLLNSYIVSDTEPIYISKVNITEDEKLLKRILIFLNWWNSAIHAPQMTSQTNQSVNGMLPDEIEETTLLTLLEAPAAQFKITIP